MGPTVGILIRETASAMQDFLGALTKALDPGAVNGEDIRVASTRSIGGVTDSQEGRSFSISFADIQSAYEETELQAIESAFGFRPEAEIQVCASSNRDIDHRMLGEIASHMARELDALVNFSGHLGVFGSGAGRLAEISYVIDPTRTGLYQVGDLAFMQAWLSDPTFHMVK